MKRIKTKTIILVLSALLIIAVAISAPYTQNWFQWVAYVFLGTLAGISAIGQIIELLGRKKDIESSPNVVQETKFGEKNSFQPKLSSDSKDIFRTSVALWGPMASGKSWLINAFAYTLLNKYTKPIEGLKYEFSGVSLGWENYFADLVTQPNPTELEVYGFPTVFRFERRRTSGNRREALSSFTHEISIADYSGEHSHNLLSSNSDEYLLSHVMTSVASADIVLIALDTLPIHHFSKKEYASLVQKLAIILDKIAPDKKRFYAMCITKADTIPAELGVDANGLIELKFGSEMLDVYKEIAKKHEIQTFITSSIGFLPSTNKPNFDLNNYSIIDKEHWKPYGVEYPFFWAFETIEKNRIKNKFRFGKLDINNYIEYPKP